MGSKNQSRVRPLPKSFFKRDTLVVAKELLGKYLVRKQLTVNNKQKVWIGKIVETEAYIGEDDLACHASKGRTPRTQVMYGEAGHTYIYIIYGMYHCLNIVTEKVGFPAAVLIRALEPVCQTAPTDLVIPAKEPESSPSRFLNGNNSGCRIPPDRRTGKSGMTMKGLKKLASGPGKLCRWMDINRGLNGIDITKNEELFIIDKIPPICHSCPPLSFPRKRESRSFGRINSSGNPENVAIGVDPRIKSEDDKGVNFEIIETKRIGVDYAKHCAAHPWRFYIKGNEFVSKK